MRPCLPRVDCHDRAALLAEALDGSGLRCPLYLFANAVVDALSAGRSAAGAAMCKLPRHPDAGYAPSHNEVYRRTCAT